MEITKLRLHKLKNGNGLELVIDKTAAAGDKVNAVEIHKAIVHNDLFNAVQGLRVHLAMMAFHVKDVEDIAMPDAETFKDFSVGSYSISGADEKRGIIISGTLRKHGKAHNFNTPFYRFEEPESARYKYMDDLAAILKGIESEVASYLDGSKRGEPAQGELELDDKGGKVTKMQIDKPIGDKVTAEGNAVSEKDKHKYAGKDQMAGVADMGKGKGGGKKKVQQTADAPSGEVES